MREHIAIYMHSSDPDKVLATPDRTRRVCTHYVPRKRLFTTAITPPSRDFRCVLRVVGVRCLSDVTFVLRPVEQNRVRPASAERVLSAVIDDGGTS